MQKPPFGFPPRTGQGAATTVFMEMLRGVIDYWVGAVTANGALSGQASSEIWRSIEWRCEQMMDNWPKNQHGSLLTQGEWDAALKALQWMASFSDDDLKTAMTLHYDFVGKAKQVLRGAL